MDKKKVLICGATGFIGRNMAERFIEKEGYEVYGTYHQSKPWVHPKITMLKADLTNKHDVEAVVQGKDMIIQAAATTSGAKDILEKPYYHVTDNAIMNSLIFRAAHEFKIKHVIFFSCTVMYPSSDIPLKEEDFDLAQDIYPTYYGVGWTKVYIEKMCKFFSNFNQTKYTVIRHSNIYGPYDKYDLERSHVFGATVTKVMTHNDGKITVWGEGKTKRDLLYVSDLVDFVERALDQQQKPYELVNIGLGEAISVKDLVQNMIEISGKNIKIEFDKTKPNIDTNLCLDCAYAKLRFGWAPKISLEQGIQKTLAWYQVSFCFK